MAKVDPLLPVIKVSPELHERVTREVANRKAQGDYGASISQVVRQALERYFAEQKESQAKSRR